MHYELMFPQQIRQAIAENWPVAMAVGVLEYHAEHCVVGVDTLVVVRALEELDGEMNLVILPPYYYGAASYAVDAPEGKGSIHVGADAMHGFARDLFRSLLRVGFRNLHVFIHHQSENFTAGMPTDLAFKLAGRQAIFELLEAQMGEGWWGQNAMANYYSEHEQGVDPFNWIQIHPFMDAESQQQFPIDHAGKQETSLMMALCPEGVDMSRLSLEKWFTAQAPEASPEYGNAARKAIMAGMRQALQ